MKKLSTWIATSRLSALRSAWRLTQDLSRTPDASLVQFAYSRSAWCRKSAYWDEITATMMQNPELAEVIRQRRRVPWFNIPEMLALPEGSLGHVFASHIVQSNIQANRRDPVPIETDSEYLFVHFVETHDIWHVVSGFGVDDLGEMSIVGFTAAQFAMAPHFALVAAIIFLNTAFYQPASFGPRMEALMLGFQVGRNARPLIAADWPSLWETPLADVRKMFALPAEPETVGLGLMEAPPHLAHER